MWRAAQPKSGLTPRQWDQMYARIGRQLTWRIWQLALFEASNALRAQENEIDAFMERVDRALYAVTTDDGSDQETVEQLWAGLRAG